ncbi:MAG TPA: hypothetical protein VFH47_00265, partial [Candidatus Thermoplasmatota archaeon]|nr:hypothetical protein [Candidatus Thermoplasmatota archaeon]
MRVQAGPWLAIVSLLALPAASAQALLAGVVPDLPGAAEGDEAVMVGALEDVSLGGWSLSDGEGAWRLPPLQLRRGEVATFTGNVSRWAAFDGRADAQWPAGTLRLANDGDDVRLLRPDGSLADSFAWGDGRAPGMDGSVRYTSPALVYRRLPAAHGGQPWTDTDSADDWRTPRMHRVGESSHPPLRLQAEGAVLYASPDSSHAVLAQAIRSARERLHLHVYDLRSPSLVDLLVEQRAAHPLLDLQVLVEDRPVGQDTLERHETAWALRRIEAAGGTAWLAGSVRYAHHHLKVLVADDQVAVQSENWVPSGVPQDPTWGNRGWGVLLRGAAVADAVAAWLAADRAAHDTARFQLATYAPTYEEPVRRPPRAGTHQPVPPLAVARPLEVQLVLAPDHTADPRADPVAALVRDARREVLVQQLDV